jgi:hypothetical protein
LVQIAPEAGICKPYSFVRANTHANHFLYRIPLFYQRAYDKLPVPGAVVAPAPPDVETAMPALTVTVAVLTLVIEDRCKFCRIVSFAHRSPFMLLNV